MKKLLTCTFLALLLIEPAFAGTAGLPWEGPLAMIKNSLTGPVAFAISLIGITVAGGMLIFGGELGEFARRIIMLVLVLALLVSAQNILSILFSKSDGAVFAQYENAPTNSLHVSAPPPLHLVPPVLG